MIINNRTKICIIGLGYVGLPLAIKFSKYFQLVGFDLNLDRVKNLKKKFDTNNEISRKILSNSKAYFTKDHKDINNCDVFIITVPTPISKNNNPNLLMLKKATKLIANKVKKGNLIIYESTVYPGVTENICIPIIEKISNLKFYSNQNKNNKNIFYCGYSPERVNPGDKKNTIEKISKLVSANDKKTLKAMQCLYKKIIKAKVIPVNNIKIAESAKVIENIQRDVNVALVNEFSIIFNKLKIPTNKVLQAASTKWNFNKYYPGLVGGHCIGVDPYYLSFIAKKNNIFPKMILSGREINNNMPMFITKKIIELMKSNSILIKKSRILILGFTFKENCADFRNTLVKDLYYQLKALSKSVHIYDPYVKHEEVKKLLKIKIEKSYSNFKYDCVILAVKHDKFKKFDNTNFMKTILKNNHLIFDLKNYFKKIKIDFSL